jgi:uncharacterized RDD family membrane protein YckC
MICRYCKTRNDEEEHRCIRCGRRLTPPDGRVPEDIPVAGAAAPAYHYEAGPAIMPGNQEQRELAPPRQPSLFPLRDPRKVIPIGSRYLSAAAGAGTTAAGRGAAPPQPAPPRQLQAPAPRPALPGRLLDSQVDLDFPPVAAPRRPAAGNDAADGAAICCNARVAPMRDRLVAAGLDVLYVVLASAALSMPLVAARALDAIRLPEARITWMLAGGGLFLVAMLYHLVWDLVGSDTPGMRACGLRLLNFDGRVPTVRQRLSRLAGTSLGVASAGVGLIWAMFDQEQLAWHDHISKTFPTRS